MTLRESAWHVTVLTQLTKVEQFRRRDLGFEESERHTVQRALNSMEELGWLQRDTETGGVWQPGVVTRYVFSEEELSTREERQLDAYLEPVAEQIGVELEGLKAQLR